MPSLIPSISLVYAQNEAQQILVLAAGRAQYRSGHILQLPSPLLLCEAPQPRLLDAAFRKQHVFYAVWPFAYVSADRGVVSGILHRGWRDDHYNARSTPGYENGGDERVIGTGRRKEIAWNSNSISPQQSSLQFCFLCCVDHGFLLFVLRPRQKVVVSQDVALYLSLRSICCWVGAQETRVLVVKKPLEY